MKTMGILSILCVIFLPGVVSASVPVLYTNDNFFSSYHDAPASLFQYETGGFYGYTETGKFYEQLPIQNLYDIKLHRFYIDDAYFYVSDRGVIAASDDLVALSIYMSRA